MDILNFISWIKGGRVVTSVDPTQTLIPVGLKDSRRDDGYLAGAITVSDLAAQLVPAPAYKVYTALFTQSGTNAPVATVLENTLGLSITWGRSSAGGYFGGDIASQCPDGKTVFITSNASNGGAFSTDPKEAYLWTYNIGASRYLNFNIKSISSSGAATSVDWDSPKVLLLEIRVYS
jgi:hypothetical protein